MAGMVYRYAIPVYAAWDDVCGACLVTWERRLCGSD